MEHVRQDIVDRIRDLSDLELAALLCLVADEHCLIATEDGLVDTLERELEVVSIYRGIDNTAVPDRLVVIRGNFWATLHRLRMLRCNDTRRLR
jgi:hypothetical protein